MDAHSLNNATINELLSIFDQIYTHNNLLVLDNKLSPIINFLLPFKVFKQRAKFDKITLSDSINHEVIQQYQNIIILFDEDTPISIPEHARVTIIIKNLTKSRLYELNQQYHFGLSFDEIIENKLDMVRAKTLKIYNWQFKGIEVDPDIISLQGSLAQYFDEPIYQVNQLANALVNLVDKFNIKINSTYAQGSNSNIFTGLYENKLQEHLAQKYNNLQQEFYSNHLTPTHNLVVIERNLDFLPVMMSQLNYVGLIDDLVSININLVKIVNDQGKEEQIKVEDELFENLKYLNFSLVGPKLNKLAKWIKNQYTNNSSEMNLKDIKKLVSSLTDLNRQQDLVKKHTNLSENLLNKVKNGGANRYNEYEIVLEFENEVFQLTYKQQISKLLEFLDLNLSARTIINSLVIVSTINSGIRSRDYEQIKQQAFENYGITIIYQFEKLFKYCLVRLSDVETLDTYTAGVTGGINVHNNNYTLLNKFWNLHPEEQEDDQEINGIEDYPHPSFALPSATVPLTIRVIESLFVRDFLTYKPINKITKQPSWQNLGLDKMFKGKVSETIGDATVKNTILVFVGGITWSEISCIKYLNHKLQARELNHQFVVLTNSIVGNRQFGDSLQ
ncbi:Vacuolar protein-sorting-associated protein 33 [Yamadazyma tenuis]|uniref:Sec1-like protein n=1 Tax=Candida tenuis (strain ATCC 10573 / BCRC 21748 / CBS 615 / JCM 9827 / NBRC 10315 / NRRL Y-1498 / VKM Y-70) TaxID=590646 RepID=G3B3G2_CANTC|nr:uncharacterized protein CANTEDRAFT_122388 [Yamadazyma tenuis ATCC 10573]EGV64155.1 hypothetical protein CANTEDRAFT_122388 [Yamadazyma tenuis ATCC 10573]WEJ96198.1 Vacuolar protein-sorting-associated protein 33 [Yamadazyma tenuis]